LIVADIKDPRDEGDFRCQLCVNSPHSGGAHERVQNIDPMSLLLLIIVLLLEAGPEKSLELCEAPELNHVFTQEMLQELDSIVLQTPEKEDASVKEGVFLDFTRVLSFSRQLNQLLDVCLFN
jgi:hypothetical protein